MKIPSPTIHFPSITSTPVQSSGTLVRRKPAEGEIKRVSIRGIHFTPPDCETVDLTCTPSGRLSSIIGLLAAPHYFSPNGVYSLPVKTQYEGPDTHIALVMLLKYLEKEYFRDLEVYDEGRRHNDE